jgi:N-sulfoglucosamine sulfohydrolase
MLENFYKEVKMSNLFVITLDDVNFYNFGFTKYFQHYSSPTPNIDQLSQESYVFWNAHCNIPFCQQSRMVLLTGLYPQNNGALNFNPIKSNIKTLPLILKENNFYTHIIGKLIHHKPDTCFNWNEKEDFWESIITESIKNSIFKNINNFFLINLENTHRPFYFDFTNGIAFNHKPENFINDVVKIKSQHTRPLFEGSIPSNIPDTTLIRQDIYSFFKSLKKADDTIGDILSLVKEDDTVVLTSDHGFSFPYFKGNCYGASTNVPLIIKNKNIKNQHDKRNLVSHVDFLPTILDLLSIKSDVNFDGKSYLKTLQGKFQQGFEVVYSQLNQMATGGNSRIRAITDNRYTYCINLDPHNAQCVDGWGWWDVLDEMKNAGQWEKWHNRTFEEFVEYSKMDIKKCDNSLIKNKLKLDLLNFMERYQDTEFENIKKIMNIKDFNNFYI